MGTPVGFEGATNVIYGSGQTTRDLPCHRGDGVVTSCWRLTPAELADVAATGVVWVAVHTYAQVSPMFVTGHALMEAINPDGSARASKAEPILTRKK